MNNRIKEIWTILGKSGNSKAGIERLRYADTSAAALYIGYKTPEMFPLFSLSVPKKYLTRPFTVSNYRSLRVDFTTDEINKDNVFLNLQLTEAELTGVFNILIGDFIHHLESVEEQENQVKIFLNQFLKWQKLFDDIPKEHLSEEAQRGLFGELIFLKKWIEVQSSPAECINGWLGPDKAVHDFKSGMCAIEVKTTISTSHQKLQINNERQLDDINLDDLFVFHLSLDQRISAGQTIPGIVEEIKILLNDHSVPARDFEIKLTLSGYFEHHINRYSDTGYFIRSARYYAVKGEFPRIKEGDIKNGVGDVKYTVAVDALGAFETNENVVFMKLANTQHG